MKKTGTKAFANLIVSIFLLAFEVFAWTQTNIIKVAKNAAVQPSTFPRIMIIGMAVFTVILLIQSIIKIGNMKPGDPLAEKAETISPLNKGVLAAFFTIALCALYVVLFRDLGYVVVSFILSAVLMWLIGTRKPVVVICLSLFVPLVIWLVFYKLLQVNIPMGWLQFVRELVDKI